LLLEYVALPDAVAAELRGAAVEIDMSDEHVAVLNDACIMLLQERGLESSGQVSDFGRRLEKIIDALNED
ncbi:MAG TPA: hypothetical protein VNT54_15040, partial [Solirubrobacteraceae bacterium]|nr:hypothetical protein [Solirubrobacteraceae bacterium]